MNDNTLSSNDRTRRYLQLPTYWNFLKFQRIPAHKISYLECGDPANDKVVVCVHGLTRNAHDFDDLGDFLSKGFRVISIDMAGRGWSDWFVNKKHYNYHTYVKDILLLIKALNLPPVYWVGTSMGGLIGMCLATYYPKIIKAMILNDIGPEMPNKTLDRIRKYTSSEAAFDTFEEIAQFIKVRFRRCGITQERDWAHMAQTSVMLCDDRKYRLNYDPGIAEKATQANRSEFLDLWYLWKKVYCPVLLIHGAKSDVLLPSTIEKMRKYRDFDLHTIEEAGHAPALVYRKDLGTIGDWLTGL